MSDAVTIYEIMRAQNLYKGDRHSGDFGVEIETESTTVYDYPRLKFWNCDRDNSLRNYGVEYILKSPMNQKEFSHALNEFDICKKKFKFLPNEVSTSVHVHLNFLNDSYLTLANFFTAYALFENLLVNYAGPDRLSNLFCLPMRDAEGVFTNMVDILNAIQKKFWRGTVKPLDSVKYGGLNVAPLTKLGTIEVRLFRGETDINVIDSWVSILMKLKNFARQDINPSTIMGMYKKHGESLVDIVFEDYAKNIKVNNSKELINKNLFFAASLSNVCKNWNQFGILKIKKIYKEKVIGVLDNISIERFKMPYNELDWVQRIIIQEIYARQNPEVRVVEQQEDI